MASFIGQLGVPRIDRHVFRAADDAALWNQIYAPAPEPAVAAQPSIYNQVFAPAPAVVQPVQSYVQPAQTYVPQVQTYAPQMTQAGVVQPTQYRAPASAWFQQGASPSALQSMPGYGFQAPGTYDFLAPSAPAAAEAETKPAPVVAVASPTEGLTDFSQPVLAEDQSSGQQFVKAYEPSAAAAQPASEIVPVGVNPDGTPSFSLADSDSALNLEFPDRKASASQLADARARQNDLAKQIDELNLSDKSAPERDAAVGELKLKLDALNMTLPALEEKNKAVTGSGAALMRLRAVSPAATAAVDANAASQAGDAAVAARGLKPTVEALNSQFESRVVGLQKDPVAAASVAEALSGIRLAGDKAVQSGSAEAIAAYEDTWRKAAATLENTTQTTMERVSNGQFHLVFTGEGGKATALDVAALEWGDKYLDGEAGLAAPGLKQQVKGTLVVAKAQLASDKAAKDPMTELINSTDAKFASLSKGMNESEAALAEMRAQALPIRIQYKMDAEALIANEADPAKVKEGMSLLGERFNSQMDGVVAKVRATEIKSGNPFINKTYGGSEYNWESIMAAGGLALALFAPLERSLYQRRAEKREDKQWQREKDWQLQQAEVMHNYRMEEQQAALEAQMAIAETNAAGSAKGRPSGVSVAQFA